VQLLRQTSLSIAHYLGQRFLLYNRRGNSSGGYSAKCLERLYEKVSNAGQSPHHEATHGSIYERFAART
jgi:hypothetical protein